MTFNRDLDNINKILIDALQNNEVIPNDCQISRIESRKIVSKGIDRRLSILIEIDDQVNQAHVF